MTIERQTSELEQQLGFADAVWSCLKSPCKTVANRHYIAKITTQVIRRINPNDINNLRSSGNEALDMDFPLEKYMTNNRHRISENRRATGSMYRIASCSNLHRQKMAAAQAAGAEQNSASDGTTPKGGKTLSTRGGKRTPPRTTYTKYQNRFKQMRSQLRGHGSQKYANGKMTNSSSAPNLHQVYNINDTESHSGSVHSVKTTMSAPVPQNASDDISGGLLSILCGLPNVALANVASLTQASNSTNIGPEERSVMTENNEFSRQYNNSNHHHQNYTNNPVSTNRYQDLSEPPTERVVINAATTAATYGYSINLDNPDSASEAHNTELPTGGSPSSRRGSGQNSNHHNNTPTNSSSAQDCYNSYGVASGREQNLTNVIMAQGLKKMRHNRKAAMFINSSFDCFDPTIRRQAIHTKYAMAA